jgi:hypothetical protein
MSVPDHLCRPRALRLLRHLAALVLLMLGLATPAFAALTSNSYDGNIYALYAGNGSLVPPRTSLGQSLASHRTAVLVYYLDDCGDCKRFAPVVSEIQRSWGNTIDLIPLVTDPLQGRDASGKDDPGRYWNGSVPQVVVIDPQGEVRLDTGGQVSVAAIQQAISQATGIPLPEGASGGERTLSLNELNTEVVN